MLGNEGAASVTEKEIESREIKGLVTSREKNVDVQLCGYINRAVLAVGNGDVSEAYLVDNTNSQTRIGVNASVKNTEGSNVGGIIEYGI